MQCPDHVKVPVDELDAKTQIEGKCPFALKNMDHEVEELLSLSFKLKRTHQPELPSGVSLLNHEQSRTKGLLVCEPSLGIWR